jgi:hypothetical protein
MASGTASEVKGAVFVRGVQAYRFQATAATISASSLLDSSVLHITGDLEVSDDAMAATMHCKNLNASCWGVWTVAMISGFNMQSEEALESS